MLNSLVEFHGKNDQPRKNLDKLTIYFFLKTVFWAFYMVNRVSLYLLGKHKQTCFIIPYSICSFLSSFSLAVFIKLRKLSKFYYLRGNCSRANYPGSNNWGHFFCGGEGGGQFSSGAIVRTPPIQRILFFANALKNNCWPCDMKFYWC